MLSNSCYTQNLPQRQGEFSSFSIAPSGIFGEAFDVPLDEATIRDNVGFLVG